MLGGALLSQEAATQCHRGHSVMSGVPCGMVIPGPVFTVPWTRLHRSLELTPTPSSFMFPGASAPAEEPQNRGRPWDGQTPAQVPAAVLMMSG